MTDPILDADMAADDEISDQPTEDPAPTEPTPDEPTYTSWQYEGEPQACSWCGALVPTTQQAVHTARELASQEAIEYMRASRASTA